MPLPVPSLRRLCVCTLVALLLVVAWDASGLDVPLARWAGTAGGFAWRSQPLFVLALHEVPRAISSVLLLALFVGAVRPWGMLRRWPAQERWQLALSIALAMAAVTLLKRASSTSCPWDLAEFGGAVPYVSHWSWGVRDGGGGHCFPAGHASAAFAFVAGWFAVRRRAPQCSGPWLAAALLAGLVLGLAQQLRGAHYMSHTLWTAWICWSVGLATEGLMQGLGLRRQAPGQLNEA
ncbi:phosphatase PAP2 family protein [Pulveribacter suum]|uniref:PAP2 family protein n=1 Tax=Pulveribacter suum TaxID=2116657 RepID=A0A2P1NKR2_9BURK|nr:phosphatase PAP2 family protein [Pulveribacter suum]AVP57631.1 PAP2 family protein [Pulveribacter suum]